MNVWCGVCVCGVCVCVCVCVVCVYVCVCVCVCVCVVCQLSMTSSRVCCTRRPNLSLPEDGQDIWSKYVGVEYNK